VVFDLAMKSASRLKNADERELNPYRVASKNLALGGLAAQRWGELRVALANSYLIGGVHIM
jgi:hypothetical protein